MRSIAPILRAFGVVIGGLVGAASAEPPAVEHKRIPPDMAGDVAAAVKRAADFLRQAQEPDGGWTYGEREAGPGLAAHNAEWRPAFSCMVGVALARAGARAGDPVIDRLHAYLKRTLGSRTGPGSRSTFLRKTYGASAFLWFLAEARSSEMHADAASATLALTNGAAEGGLWGYELPDVVVQDGYARVEGLTPAVAGPADLSNSQFAVLGLLAAERLGILRTGAIWERVRDAHRKIVHRDGGFGYRFRPGEPDVFMHAGRTSTAIGATCSYLALRRTGATPEAAAQDPTVRQAIRWLAKHPVVRRADGSLDTSEPGDIGTRVPYYDLVALERLGAFTGLDRLAGIEWYRVGAGYLLSTQEASGGWPAGAGHVWTSPVSSVFALIFLTRAADDFPVTTPAVTPIDVAGLADVPEPLFSETLATAIAAAARDVTTPESAKAWRDAFFAAGPRVLGVLFVRLASGSEAERAYVLRLLPDLVDRAPADAAAAPSAADWRAWYEASKSRVMGDPTTRRFRIAAK